MKIPDTKVGFEVLIFVIWRHCFLGIDLFLLLMSLVLTSFYFGCVCNLGASGIFLGKIMTNRVVVNLLLFLLLRCFKFLLMWSEMHIKGCPG